MEGSAKRRRICENDGIARGASCSYTSTEAQEVATSSGYDYEVFLSFRGPDTREGFTDHLYTRLDDAGIRTFKDDEELRIGEEFAPKLLEAIEQSKISIPIFSKRYASSIWCLKELVRMVECWKNGRQKIMPIFYDVAPSEVRHQSGGYEEAFRFHEEKQRYDKETMHQWKAALKAVSFLNGWDLYSKTNRREGEFAKEVTEEVFRELKKAYLVVSDCLVSVDNQVDAIMEMIGAQTSETQIIGIHGMGGIGKTTIAKIIYNQLSRNFKDCCFLSNIRETSERKGIECLQNQLISDILKMRRTDINNVDVGTQMISRLSNKRVLLLLDDVEEENHIDAFVGKRDWLGRGSKIIITTRNKDILAVPKVDLSYEISFMNHDQSLQLFSKHAFRRDSPLDEYMDESNKAISIAGGLPLALEVIGSLLCRTKKEKWDGKLKELENVPPKDVQSKLEISYNALRDREQHIFLDIACLFIGYDKDVVICFWDESIFFPKEAMDVLENMSLIKINKDNKVWMHDQLRDLGREIVCRESNRKIEKQSRVWNPKQGLDLMRRPKRNKEVEALRVLLDDRHQYRFTYEGFESLSDLRFLEVNSQDGNFRVEERLLCHESSSNLIPDNSDLLPQLRWLSWPYIPPTFNITNFFMENIAILNLSQSNITHYWKGWSHMKVMEKLKVLDLSHCDKLESLPDELGEDLTSLEYLSLSWCSSLKRLPDTVGNLKSLIKLDITLTKIKELHDSIGKLQNLKVVMMCECDLEKIPDAFWTLEKVEQIEGYRSLDRTFHMKIGDCIYNNQSLRILRLWNTDIFRLPRLPESLIMLQLSGLRMDTYPDLSNLTNLKELDLGFCSSDRSSCGHVKDPLPQWIENLRKLESLGVCFEWSGPNLPTAFRFPDQLRTFRPPRLPSSLSSLRLDYCDSDKDSIRWAYQI